MMVVIVTRSEIEQQDEQGAVGVETLNGDETIYGGGIAGGEGG
jgi:hypothetical protein